MIEPNDSRSLINSQILGIDHITIPVKNLAFAEQFYVGVLGGKVLFKVDADKKASDAHQTIPYFSVVIGDSPKLDLFLQVWGQPNTYQVHPHIAFKVKGEDLMRWQVLLESKGILTAGPIPTRVPGQASLYFDDPFGNHLELFTSDFLGAIHLSSQPPCESQWYIPRGFIRCSLNTTNQLQSSSGWKHVSWHLPITHQETPAVADDAFLALFRQRWEKEIYNRFREARKRFPEFFPCFELKDNLGTGLQYSIHFKPLTEHAKTLSCNVPLFPQYEEFKAIEQLWNEDGQSELDLIFERFPTQLALKPPKEPWETRWWRLLLKLIDQELDFKHI